jgi:hypothetical protein
VDSSKTQTRNKKKSRAEYLALGCITDYLINGSLDGLPVRHPEYQMISAPGLRTGQFYREPMYTMQSAITTEDFTFLSRSKPQNRPAQPLFLFTKKTKVEHALKGYLAGIEDEISKVVTGKGVAGSPATWKFKGDTYLFTNVEIGAQEFPWKEAYAGPQGVSIVTEVA